MMIKGPESSARDHPHSGSAWSPLGLCPQGMPWEITPLLRGRALYDRISQSFTQNRSSMECLMYITGVGEGSVDKFGVSSLN